MEERVRDLETNYALLHQQMNANGLADADFRKRVVEDLEFLKKQNIINDENNKTRDELIESIADRERAKADFWMEIRQRLAFSGIWGAIILVLTVVWYAVTRWVHN